MTYYDSMQIEHNFEHVKRLATTFCDNFANGYVCDTIWQGHCADLCFLEGWIILNLIF